jgi:hypothetical protein
MTSTASRRSTETICQRGSSKNLPSPPLSHSQRIHLTTPQGYAEAYKRTLTQGTSAFRLIFQHLASPNPCPILFHCSAGKDCTGVVSMLLLSLAGCNTATIAYEYALTDLNTDWRASSIQRLLAQPGLSGDVSEVTNVVRARSEYMVATLEMLEREFGGVEGYCRGCLRLGEGEIEAVRANVLMGL